MRGGRADEKHLRDLRSGGRWTPRQKLKNDSVFVLLRIALFVADRCPAPLLMAMGRRFGLMLHLLAPSVRSRTQQALEEVLGPTMNGTRSSACLGRAGENLALALLLRRPSFRVLDHVDVDEHSLQTLAGVEQSGALVLAAHHGPFEWIAAAVAELGFPVSMVVRESYDPRIDTALAAHRKARALEVLHRGDPQVVQRVAGALRAGRLVGVLPDLPGRAACERVSLLQGSLLVARGPGVLLRRTSRPVLFAALERTSEARRTPLFRLKIEALDVPHPSDTARVYAKRLGLVIAAHPLDWLWGTSAQAPT